MDEQLTTLKMKKIVTTTVAYNEDKIKPFLNKVSSKNGSVTSARTEKQYSMWNKFGTIEGTVVCILFKHSIVIKYQNT